MVTCNRVTVNLIYAAVVTTGYHWLQVCKLADSSLVWGHDSSVVDLGWFLGFHGTPLWAGSTTKKVLMIG